MKNNKVKRVFLARSRSVKPGAEPEAKGPAKWNWKIEIDWVVVPTKKKRLCNAKTLVIFRIIELSR